MPGILIVDDHPAIRRTVRFLLESQYLHVCGEAEDGAAAIEKATDLRPDIILLDISMPLMNGVDAAREIRRILPETKIVFLTMDESGHWVEKTRPLAHGFIYKSRAAKELIPKVQQLLAEPANPQPVFSYSWQQIVADACAATRETLLAKISLAEMTIAGRLAELDGPDREECKALKEALQLLRNLISEARSSQPSQQQGEQDKYGAA